MHFGSNYCYIYLTASFLTLQTPYYTVTHKHTLLYNDEVIQQQCTQLLKIATHTCCHDTLMHQ